MDPLTNLHSLVKLTTDAIDIIQKLQKGITPKTSIKQLAYQDALITGAVVQIFAGLSKTSREYTKLEQALKKYVSKINEITTKITGIAEQSVLNTNLQQLKATTSRIKETLAKREVVQKSTTSVSISTLQVTAEQIVDEEEEQRCRQLLAQMEKNIAEKSKREKEEYEKMTPEQKYEHDMWGSILRRQWNSMDPTPEQQEWMRTRKSTMKLTFKGRVYNPETKKWDKITDKKLVNPK